MNSGRTSLLAGALTLSVASFAAAIPSSGGDLLVSRTTYAGDSTTVRVGDTLPGGAGNLAVANGSYPGVWANEALDGSFGVTSPIILEREAVTGDSLVLLDTFAVPASKAVTSFPSKSELALNLSTDGNSVTFMGYAAPVNALDVSNSNTPNHVDTTNPVKLSYPRAVLQIAAAGPDDSVMATPVNTYSGNNGRAAILDATGNQYFLVGNAGNGSSPEPVTVVSNTGVQEVVPGAGPETQVVGQLNGTPGAANGFQYGFSVASLALTADKSGKDDNFRSLTIHNGTLYVAKGSGGNGINTVYQVGAKGTLPTAGTASSTMFTIPKGFSTNLAKSTTGVVYNPFGLCFASDSILYVADEGDGSIALAPTNAQSGLEKWVLESDSTWHNVYTLKSGLNLGTKYAVPGMADSILPANDGLRTLTSRINGDGTVTVWAVTSTVSLETDQGADPNQLVVVTDSLASRTLPASESFKVLKTASFGQALRGVVFVPATSLSAIAGHPSSNPVLALRRTGDILSFRMAAAARARIEVLDLSGRVLESRDLGVLSAGEHTVAITGAKGLQVQRLVAGASSQTLVTAGF